MDTRRGSLSTQVRWASGINIALGAWLVIAPFLTYSDTTAAVWNDVIVGLVVLALAGYRVARPSQAVGLSWTNAVLGVWEVVAPFVLAYSAVTDAVWNDVIVGVLIVGFAGWSAVVGTRLRGGGAMRRPRPGEGTDTRRAA